MTPQDNQNYLDGLSDVELIKESVVVWSIDYTPYRDQIQAEKAKRVDHPLYWMGMRVALSI